MGIVSTVISSVTSTVTSIVVAIVVTIAEIVIAAITAMTGVEISLIVVKAVYVYAAALFAMMLLAVMSYVIDSRGLDSVLTGVMIFVVIMALVIAAVAGAGWATLLLLLGLIGLPYLLLLAADATVGRDPSDPSSRSQLFLGALDTVADGLVDVVDKVATAVPKGLGRNYLPWILGGVAVWWFVLRDTE